MFSKPIRTYYAAILDTQLLPPYSSIALPLLHSPTTMATAAAITLPLTSVKHRSLVSTSSSLWFSSSSIQPPRNLQSISVSAACKPSFRVFSSMSIQAPEKASAASFLDRKESGILHFVKYHGLGNDFILVCSSLHFC